MTTDTTANGPIPDDVWKLAYTIGEELIGDEVRGSDVNCMARAIMADRAARPSGEAEARPVGEAVAWRPNDREMKVYEHYLSGSEKGDLYVNVKRGRLGVVKPNRSQGNAFAAWMAGQELAKRESAASPADEADEVERLTRERDATATVIERLRQRNERYQGNGGVSGLYLGGDAILDCDAADALALERHRAETAEATLAETQERLQKAEAALSRVLSCGPAEDPMLSSSDSMGNYDDVFMDGVTQGEFGVANIARAYFGQERMPMRLHEMFDEGFSWNDRRVALEEGAIKSAKALLEHSRGAEKIGMESNGILLTIALAGDAQEGGK